MFLNDMIYILVMFVGNYLHAIFYKYFIQTNSFSNNFANQFLVLNSYQILGNLSSERNSQINVDKLTVYERN